MRTLLLLLCCVALSACNSLPQGGAEELHVKFGIPSVFSVSHDNTGISSTNGVLKAANGTTTIQILLFTWTSQGKDIVLQAAPKK